MKLIFRSYEDQSNYDRKDWEHFLHLVDLEVMMIIIMMAECHR